MFNDLIAGMLGLQYGIDSQPPPRYVPARTCWADAPSGTTGETVYATLYTAHTLMWDIGYTRGTPWAQAEGGDGYASGTLRSYAPVSPPLPPPGAFILDGTTGGYPGVATYGQDYNFDSSWLTHGETWVSSKNWLVNDTAPATDFYQLMYQRFGGAPAAVDYTDPSPVSQPAARVTPYYVTGNMTTSGSFNYD